MLEPPSFQWIIISPIIIHKPQFTIPYLATPLNRLRERASGRYLAEGSVGVGGGDATAGGVQLTDILGEIPTIGEPCAVDLDSQRASGDGLDGIPGNEPESGVGAAVEVEGCYLQVAAIDVALVQSYFTIDGDLFVRTAAQGVVLLCGTTHQ